MRTILFRCADTRRLVANLQVDDKTFNDPTIDIFTGPLARAKVRGLLKGVKTVQVAETFETSVNPDDLLWYDLPSSFL